MFDASIMALIHQKLGDQVRDLALPPPVFDTMKGEFVTFDVEAGVLVTRFPVLSEYLNPYGAMQGGMVAAAIDNTIGPLSMLVAPPNVTRRLELKYSRPVTPDLGFISVTGKFLGREGRKLNFSAEVRDQNGVLLARAQAVHWIVETGKDDHK